MITAFNRVLCATALVFISVSAIAIEKVASAVRSSETLPIINGSAGSTVNYPWIAFLANENGDQYCGASLISPTWILTAAHCFLNDASTAVDIVTGARSNIILNSNTVSPLGPAAIRGAIGQIIIHPRYQPNAATSPNSSDFDMALVELTAAVQLQPVHLLASGTPEIAVGTQTLILGWGTTAVDTVKNEGINPSNVLLKANQQMVDRASCATAYGGGITNNMICAGGLSATDTTDTCQGDSGGPLSIAKGNWFVQVGVVSFGGGEGPSCGDPKTPGVYASVAALAAFIQQHAKDAIFTTLSTQASTPVLTTTVIGNSVTIGWTASSGATGYILYYAPFPAQSPIGSLDVGNLTSLTGALPPGSAFYVAVQPYNSAGAFNLFSNVGLFTIGGN